MRLGVLLTKVRLIFQMIWIMRLTIIGILLPFNVQLLYQFHSIYKCHQVRQDSLVLLLSNQGSPRLCPFHQVGGNGGTVEDG